MAKWLSHVISNAFTCFHFLCRFPSLRLLHIASCMISFVPIVCFSVVPENAGNRMFLQPLSRGAVCGSTNGHLDIIVLSGMTQTWLLEGQSRTCIVQMPRSFYGRIWDYVLPPPSRCLHFQVAIPPTHKYPELTLFSFCSTTQSHKISQCRISHPHQQALLLPRCQRVGKYSGMTNTENGKC